MRNFRWRMTEVKPFESGSMLYRFDKVDETSVPYSYVMEDLNKNPRRWNSKEFQRKVKAMGSSKDDNAHTH